MTPAVSGGIDQILPGFTAPDQTAKARFRELA
jgi:hypothetical protein